MLIRIYCLRTHQYANYKVTWLFKKLLTNVFSKLFFFKQIWCWIAGIQRWVKDCPRFLGAHCFVRDIAVETIIAMSKKQSKKLLEDSQSCVWVPEPGILSFHCFIQKKENTKSLIRMFQWLHEMVYTDFPDTASYRTGSPRVVAAAL